MLYCSVFVRTQPGPPLFGFARRFPVWSKSVSQQPCADLVSFNRDATPFLPPSIQPFCFHRLAHSFALFCHHAKPNPFVFRRFRTLCREKTPKGGGSPSQFPVSKCCTAPLLVRSPIPRLGHRIQFGVIWSDKWRLAALGGAPN